MTFTQLSYIVAVDTHRHFATAAEKCYVTQPTLSMQIQKLEKELGVLIFDRSKHPVVPTQMGTKIIEQARIIIKEQERMKSIATESDDELSGFLRVGIIPTVAPYLLPLFLRNFNMKYPKVDLIIDEAQTRELLHRLNEDQLDVGILATPATHNSMMEVDLYYEPFIGYLSPHHPLTEREELSVDDLDINNVWLLKEGHCFRDQTVKLCKKSGQFTGKTPIEFESGNLETLKKLVEQDFGMTLLPFLALHQMKKPGNAVIKKFEKPTPRRKVRLIYSRKYFKNDIIMAFTGEIRKSLPDELKSHDSSIIVE